MTITYEDRGVSPHKPDVKAAVAQMDHGLFPGAFCHAYPDSLTGSPAHCLLSHADGAGTKSIVAWLHYQRHGDPSIFRGIAQDSLVMNLDDLLCVGATGPFLLSNTIGRNAKLIPGDVISAIVAGYRDVCDMLARHGIEIAMTGGETADVGDCVRTLIVDSTMTTRMKRANFIDASRAQPGQVIVALASDGQAAYENRPNSGVGSNGMTAMRHEMLGKGLTASNPEAYAPEIAAHAYTGVFDIDDPVPGLGMTMGEALLSPTRTYAPIIAAILNEGREGISAIFHNSGGGQTKCMNFGSSIRYVKDNLFPVAPFFAFMRETRGLSWREMLRTFNCGYRMEILCAAERTDGIIAHASRYNLSARIVGHSEKADTTSVVVATPEGSETFTLE